MTEDIIGFLAEARDQIGHIAWAFATVALALGLAPAIGGTAAGALAGLMLAAPRELIDQRAPGSRLPILPIARSKLVDIGFFMLGGAAAGLLF